MTTATAEVNGPVVVEESAASTGRSLAREDTGLPRRGLRRRALAHPDVRAPAHVAHRPGGESDGRLVGRAHDAEPADHRQLHRDPPERGDHLCDLDDALDLARSDRHPDRGRGARRLRARLARVPGAGLAVHRRRRAPRRAHPDGPDPDLLALQQPRALRHDPRADPVPHGVRAAVRDLPACGTSSSGSPRT